MRINQINNYSIYANNIKKTNQKSVSNVNFKASASEVYARYRNAFNECFNLKYTTKLGNKFKALSEETCEENIRSIKELFRYLDYFKNYSDVTSFEAVRQVLQQNTYVATRYNRLAYKLNLNEMQSKTISEYNGKTLLGVHNLGKYDTGLFSKSEHSQVVVEFNDPETNRFIGVSPSVDDGLAITTNNGRVEFYPYGGSGYKVRAITNQGYQPSTYDAVFTEYGAQDNNDSTGFWDWFRNL